ncbi:MAG: hypothetical protein ACKVHP_13005, partial [Verrucomicrobiales bacterium]
RLLRNQENQIGSQQEAIEDQERAFVNALEGIYGTPYAGDIGPGKTYAQGYQGPDTERWFIIDRPTDLVNTTTPITVTVRVPNQVRGFTGNAITDIISSYNSIDTVKKTLSITPNRFVQFATVLDPTGGLGSRPLTGSLQQALIDSYLAQVTLTEANQHLQVLQQRFVREAAVFTGLVHSHVSRISERFRFAKEIKSAELAASILGNVGSGLIAAAATVQEFADAASEGLPRVVGLATDATSIGRAAFKFVAAGGGTALTAAGLASKGASSILAAKVPGLNLEMEQTLTKIGFNQDELQAAYEFEELYRELLNQHFHFANLMAQLQSSNQE